MLAEVGRSASARSDADQRALGRQELVALVGYLRELAFLARTAGTIRTAIGAIRRIVGALKRYSRLDEAPLERVDVHAGIEDTLIILSHQLKYGEDGVTVKRSFGALPRSRRTSANSTRCGPTSSTTRFRPWTGGARS